MCNRRQEGRDQKIEMLFHKKVKTSKAKQSERIKRKDEFKHEGDDEW